MRFTRIEVHFQVKDGPVLRVVIEGNSKLKGITLTPNNPSGDRKRLKEFITVKDEQDKTVLPEDVDDGPGLCYDVGGSPVCW